MIKFVNSSQNKFIGRTMIPFNFEEIIWVKRLFDHKFVVLLIDPL